MNCKELIINILVICLLGLGCTSDDCSGNLIEVKSLEDAGCQNANSGVTVISDSEFALIRNQADYDLLIIERCAANVDWMQYDLVIGNYLLDKGIGAIEKSLRMNCELNRLDLTFSIQLNTKPLIQQIALHALIPKLKDDLGIFVDVILLE